MKTTPLFEVHQEFGAKFGEFAGYNMPLFYPAGIISEHQNTRKSAGLFDISHMMHVEVEGDQAQALLMRLCPIDPEALKIGEAKYTFLLNDTAGIIDDLIVTRLANNRFLMVCNAGRANEDWQHITTQAANFEVEVIKKPRGFIALQGPQAAAILADNGINTDDLKFMRAKKLDNNWAIARSGYTGEDGFEIATPENEIAEFTRKLLSDERVLPVGLGARDSLRLEAGLSLYGQDLDIETTPMEAGLIWAIAKHLRSGGQFIGAKSLEEKITQKRQRKRIGLIPEGKAPIRTGTPLFDNSQSQIGTVTSGGFGPTVEHPIALAMINVDADIDSLTAEVRTRMIPVRMAKLPFVPHQYKH